MVPETSIQLTLFDLPRIEGFRVSLRGIQDPIWTENKAKLIERYLYYFVLVTKHGCYIDGFAGPQLPDKPETWAAKLVLESEPPWLRKFFLCDNDPSQVAFLEQLRKTQPQSREGGQNRVIRIYPEDFNDAVHKILKRGDITEKEATFCLIDQRTFECKWSTIRALANHKKDRKIELFYFLPTGWLGRALNAQRDPSVPEAWWGHSDWRSLQGMKRHNILELFCNRFKSELNYKSAVPWPIFEKKDGGRVMYDMIHATDHPEAPNLMSRAYRKAVGEKETPDRFQLEFEEWKFSMLHQEFG